MANPKKIAAALGACAVLAVTGAGVWATSDAGRMLLSNEAADLADDRVDTETVDYYRAVCSAVNSARSTPETIMTSVTDSIGEDDDQRANNYRLAAQAATGALEQARGQLSDTEGHAPTVTRADGVEVDYGGALVGLVSTVDDARQRAARAVHGDGLDDDTMVDVARGLSDDVSALVEQVSGLSQSAPILSSGTRDVILTDAGCSRLLGSEFAKDDDEKMVVSGVVDVAQRAEDAYAAVDDPLSRASAASSLSLARPETLRDFLITQWSRVRDAAGTSADMLGGLFNPYPTNTREYRAWVGAHETAEDAPEAYRELARTAGALVDELESADTFEDTVEAMQAHADAISAAQVGVVKARSTASVSMPMPTQATADKVRAARESTPDERAAREAHAVNVAAMNMEDAMKDFDEATRAAEKMTLPEVRAEVAAGLRGIGQAARGARCVPDNVSAHVVQIADWSDGAAARVKSAGDGQLIDVIRVIVGELREQTGDLGDAVAEFFATAPYRGPGTSQAISQARAAAAELPAGERDGCRVDSEEGGDK